MQYFQYPEPDERRRVFLSLAGQIESQLRDAYAKKHDEQGVTQTDLAKKLGVNKSAINHRLKGHVNMTVETIADMVWALEHAIKVTIYDPGLTRVNRVVSAGDETFEVPSKNEGRLFDPSNRKFESAPA